MDNQVIVLALVRNATKELTTQEMASLYMAASLGNDPRRVTGYEKAKSLFTENDGTRMHRDTLAAFNSIVSERLDAEL
jgi:hypothetical protein